MKVSLEASELQPGSGRGNLSSRLVLAGAIAAVAIGVAAVSYSIHIKRRENSVEYHKAEYVAVRNGTPTLMGAVWSKVTGQTPRRYFSFKNVRRHEQALFRLGYWREQTFVVSNKPVATVLGIAFDSGANLWRPELTKEICVVAATGTNTIVVRAVPEHIPIWAGLIRDADVPWGK